MTKEECIENIDISIALLQRTKLELEKSMVNKDEKLIPSFNGEYSLAKVKRNCVTVRQLINDVKGACNIW